MSHEKFKEWMYLAVSNEIGDAEMRSLNEHLLSCVKCQKEYDELKQLVSVVENAGPAEPPSEALQQARIELMEAIRHETLKGVADAERSVNETSAGVFGWRSWFNGYRLALSGAATMMIGVFAGYLMFAQPDAVAPQQTAVLTETEGSGSDTGLGLPSITNVRFLDVGTRDGEIEIQYDLVRPVRLRASADDAQMKRMLTYAVLNENNPGVRLQAINALDVVPNAPQGGDIKEALIGALKSDSNAGVRKQAFMVLSKLSFDNEVKEACFYVLSNDENPGMRVAAINILAQAVLDGNLKGEEVYDVLKSEIQQEGNGYLRSQSGAFIREASDVN